MYDNPCYYHTLGYQGKYFSYFEHLNSVKFIIQSIVFQRNFSNLDKKRQSVIGLCDTPLPSL